MTWHEFFWKKLSNATYKLNVNKMNIYYESGKYFGIQVKKQQHKAE